MTFEDAVEKTLHDGGKVTADLARVLNVKEQSVNSVYAKGNPRPSTVYRYCKALEELGLNPTLVEAFLRPSKAVIENVETGVEETQMPTSDLEAMVLTALRSAPDKIKACRAIMEEVLRQKGEDCHQQRTSGHKVA